MWEALKTAQPLLELVLIPLLTLAVKAMFAIRNELRGLRTVIVQVEQWRVDHENGHEIERERINRELDMIHTRMTNGNGRYLGEG